MMISYTIIFIVGFSFSLENEVADVCLLPREEYISCGSSCPDTCENYGQNRHCAWECRQGCFCKEGYVRDSRNKTAWCILPTQCTDPPVCDRFGEEYRRCSFHCEPSCEERYDPRPSWCQLKCSGGCVCKTGFIRDYNWNCIPIERCPSKTGPGFNCTKDNEFYNDCGSKCSPTCENYGKLISCDKSCVQGCFCREGFVRDELSEGQLCIYPTDCTNPPVCIGAGEDFNYCGTHCPLTCDNYQDPPDCVALCKQGCFCKKGLVRNKECECVLPKQCEKEGGHTPCTRKGEILDDCGCELKCTGRSAEYTKHCPAICVQSCTCKPGLARHPTKGSCIPKTDCPTIHQIEETDNDVERISVKEGKSKPGPRLNPKD